MPEVAILMGSDSDLETLEPAFGILEEFGISYEARVISAHRSPDRLVEYVRASEARVFIGAAGGAAHLPGVIAGLTVRPVIGVPVPTRVVQSLDSILSILQMPAGVPVATVAVGEGGARNAAILAAQILSLANPELEERLKEYKRKLDQSVQEKDERLRERVRKRRS